MANVKLVPTFSGKISFDHILLAHERIQHYLHTTPVFQNEALNGLCRTDDWPMTISCKGASKAASGVMHSAAPSLCLFRLESLEYKFIRDAFCAGEFLQKTGSFKSRGALNAVLKLKGRVLRVLAVVGNK